MADSVELPDSDYKKPEELPGSVVAESEVLLDSDDEEYEELLDIDDEEYEELLDIDDEEPEFASEMEIIVRLGAVHNYVLLADGDNTVEDVLVEILGTDRAAQAPEPKLYFNDLELEKQKTLAEHGIKPGSVLQLKCTPRVLARSDDPAEIAKMDSAESGSSMRPNGDDQMKIYVQSEYDGNYLLHVDSSNTIQDVLVTILPKRQEATALYFNGDLLERAKSLADYSIEDGSILHLECPNPSLIGKPRHKRAAIETEMPYVIRERKRIIITDQPLTIWEKEHNKVLLSLLVEQISNGGRNNILNPGMDSWCNIVAKFNESTGHKYEYKHLLERFKFYEHEYQIVNCIKHHPKFSWDHQRQIVIATDAEWNDYIKRNHAARPYRRRAIPYIDMLEVVFADKEEPKIMVSNE